MEDFYYYSSVPADKAVERMFMGFGVFLIGIDIQEIDRLPEKRAVRHRAARRLFTEKICEKIKTSRDPEREFIRHFAIREALYKQRSPQTLSGTVPR